MSEMTAQERKDRPVFSGVLAYFPDALLEVAAVSKAGNDQHNPGQPLHWAKDKSTDHDDCIERHHIDVAKGNLRDTDGQRHRAKIAWRALAALQIEIETERAQVSPTTPVAPVLEIGDKIPDVPGVTIMQSATRQQLNDAMCKDYAAASGPTCTRLKGHTGRHASTANGIASRVWS